MSTVSTVSYEFTIGGEQTGLDTWDPVPPMVNS
jgi:hypothetical protein